MSYGPSLAEPCRATKDDDDGGSASFASASSFASSCVTPRYPVGLSSEHRSLTPSASTASPLAAAAARASSAAASSAASTSFSLFAKATAASTAASYRPIVVLLYSATNTAPFACTTRRTPRYPVELV